MKFFAGLFVALVAVHASSQSPVQDTDISGMIVNVLDRVLNETKILLGRANTFADQLDSNKGDYEKQAADFLTNAGVRVNKLILDLVERLREDASDEGKAVLDCVEAEKDAVNAAIGKVMQKLLDIEFQNYDEFSTLVKTVVAQLSDLQGNLEALTSNLSDCGAGDLICLGIFGAGVLEQVEENVIPNGKADLSDLRALISNIRNVTVESDLVEAIHDEAKEIFDEAVTCVRKC